MKLIKIAHTSENIKALVTKVLVEFGIVPQCFVANNTANQVKANDLLADWNNDQAAAIALQRANSDDIMEVGNVDEDDLVSVFPDVAIVQNVRTAFDLPTEAIGCHCHHLELAIHHTLKKSKDELDQSHKFAQHTRNNEQTRLYLERFVPEDSLIKSVRIRRHCDTRWSSLFRVLSDYKSRLGIFYAACNELLQPRVQGQIKKFDNLYFECGCATDGSTCCSGDLCNSPSWSAVPRTCYLGFSDDSKKAIYCSNLGGERQQCSVSKWRDRDDHFFSCADQCC